MVLYYNSLVWSWVVYIFATIQLYEPIWNEFPVSLSLSLKNGKVFINMVALHAVVHITQNHSITLLNGTVWFFVAIKFILKTRVRVELYSLFFHSPFNMLRCNLSFYLKNEKYEVFYKIGLNAVAMLWSRIVSNYNVDLFQHTFSNETRLALTLSPHDVRNYLQQRFVCTRFSHLNEESFQRIRFHSFGIFSAQQISIAIRFDAEWVGCWIKCNSLIKSK